LSTREKTELRRELFSLGVSQISAGSKTSPGAYSKNAQKTNQKKLEQFQLGDHRDLEDVISDCCELGFLPSFCTSCYRSKRTGDRFMKLVKSGNIGKICGPNAIFTFQEYINDFLSNSNKIKSNEFLEKEIIKFDKITQIKIKNILKRINEGERDIFL
jgi:2-iminoacetate synthase